MLVQITGTRDGVAWPKVGEVKDLPDHEAKRLCANGFAEPVAEAREKKAEKAVAKQHAKAEKRG
jgi:hypothetical protein